MLQILMPCVAGAMFATSKANELTDIMRDPSQAPLKL